MINVLVSSSPAPVAHPPRWNPLLRSSSDAPCCITPCSRGRRGRRVPRCTGRGRAWGCRGFRSASSCGRRGGRRTSCRTICVRSGRGGRRSRGTRGGALCPSRRRAAGPSWRSWAGCRSAASSRRPVSRVPSAAPRRAGQRAPAGGRCRAPDHRPPLAGIKLVRPRPRLSARRCGRSSLTPPARRHTPAAARKSHNYSPTPTRRPTPQVTGSIQHALLDN